jgi:uncharacterized lipoprotein
MMIILYRVFLRIINIFLIMLLLISCSVIKKLDGSNDYKSANKCHGELILPKDLNSKSFENHYPLPKADISNNHAGIASVAPPDSSIKD